MANEWDNYIEILGGVLRAITDIHSLTARDGRIQPIEFTNHPAHEYVRGSNLDDILKGHRPEGTTGISTALEEKILNPLVHHEKLKKPLLVIVITGGEVSRFSQFLNFSLVLDLFWVAAGGCRGEGPAGNIDHPMRAIQTRLTPPVSLSCLADRS
jgi:hypothetical protein